MNWRMKRTTFGRRLSRLGPLLALLPLLVATSAGLEAVPPLGAQTTANEASTGNSELALAVASFDEAWRLVRDTHFDTTYGGVDWHALRAELRPQVLAASEPDEVRGLIHEMLGRLELSHFGLMPSGADSATVVPRGGSARPSSPGHPGLDVLIVEGRAVVSGVTDGSPAAEAGVRTGWIVEEVDGRTVPAPEVSAGKARLRLLARLRGPADREVRLVLRDERDRRLVLDVERRAPTDGVVAFGSLGDVRAEIRTERLPLGDVGTAGYVRFSSWMPALMDRLHRGLEELRDVDGLVLDLRRNGGGVGAMTMGIAGHLVDDPVSLGSFRTRDAELRFAVSPRRVDSDGRALPPFDGPVAILVDELTGSASEVFAGGLQGIGRARVFGRPSAGIVLPAVVDRLPNGDVLMHAVADFTTPDGVRLEGRGVLPDEVVEPTREALLEGRDVVLETALRWISGQTAAGHADTLPTAGEIIDRYVEAIGGRDAILARTGLQARGTLELRGMGIEGTIETYIAPGLYRMHTVMPEVGSAEVGYDGEIGWSTHDLLGPSVLSGRLLAQVREMASLTGELHEGEEIVSMETGGRIEFEGRTAWEVEIHTRDDETYTEYFDAETGLLIGKQRNLASPMGDVPTTVVLEDYRAVDGVMIPFTRSERMMGMEQVTTLTEVRAVAPAADVFEPPPEIRLLLENDRPTDERSGPEGRER